MEVISQLNVSFVPTARLYHPLSNDAGTVASTELQSVDRQAVTFRGRYDEKGENLFTWVKRFHRFPFTKVDSMVELEKLREIFGVLCVGAFADKGEEYAAFVSAATFDEVPFIYTESSKVLQELGFDESTLSLKDISNSAGIMDSKVTSMVGSMVDSHSNGTSPTSSTQLVNAVVFLVRSEEPFLPKKASGKSYSVVRYFGPLTSVYAIDSFILHNQLPAVTTYSPEVAQKIFGSPFYKHVFLFGVAESATDREVGDSGDKQKKVMMRLLSVFQDVATIIRGIASGSSQPLFVYIPFKGGATMMKHFHLSRKDLPAFLFVNHREMTTSEMNDTSEKQRKAPRILTRAEHVDKVSLLRFVLRDSSSAELSAFDAKLLQQRKSTNIGMENDIETRDGTNLNKDWSFIEQQKVTCPNGRCHLRVDGANFNAIVLKPDRDVLILFYKPYRQDLANLLEEIDKIGPLFWNVPTVDVGVFEASRELADWELIPFDEQDGLLFFPADLKSENKTNGSLYHIRFSFEEARGDLHTEILAFISTNASKPYHLGDGRFGGGLSSYLEMLSDSQKEDEKKSSGKTYDEEKDAGRPESIEAVESVELDTCISNPVDNDFSQEAQRRRRAEAENIRQAKARSMAEDAQEKEMLRKPTLKEWFENNRLQKWLHAVEKLGVETIDDLGFVNRVDLRDMGMPIIQQRRFIAGLVESGLGNTPAVSERKVIL
eukprot:g2780.t1